MKTYRKPLIKPKDDLCRRRMKALADCRLGAFNQAKNFLADLIRAHPRDMTARQRNYVELLAWRYRRQLPDDLVPPEEPKAMVEYGQRPPPAPKPHPEPETTLL